ncbi:hypothetical protein PUR59_30585 [Streptomyces sp. SP18ES09]|uniref:hypothetical protein n=1 Tax=Streptomyces sp. SP18ES09 TaxID=3002532 RepID=UPI002E7829A7|nr:hypothetical protein [Streptomyces sp. SP18ES09]MEE1819349.1 hypothetical protein [Streptomyces sp. SP18ES09]
MKCAQELFEDGSTISIYDCTRDLGHPGAHEDARGGLYARPEPRGEIDHVLAFIDSQAPQHRRWDLDDRDYYVKFEVTSVYLVKVSAESQDAALMQYEDGCDWPDFSREQAVDGSVEVRRPEHYDLSSLTGAPAGPKIACPDCGALAMRSAWYHSPYRRCHGPIEWTEVNAPNPRWRYRRKFPQGPTPASRAAA